MTMPPSQKDIDEMARLRQILEGGFTPDVGPNRQELAESQGRPSDSPVPAGVKDEQMFNFAKIVDGYAGVAEHAVEELMESNDPEVKESLVMREVKDGVKIGKWKIAVQLVEADGGQKKHFNVIHSGTDQVIAEDLWLYEAAKGLVRYLNRGFPINGKEIRGILALEEKFMNQKRDALNYRRRAAKASNDGDFTQSSMLKARFDYAREQALIAKKELVILAEEALR